jgi:broad specificity phosphatase PhoE
MTLHMYLIRHGETDWNKNRQIQGQLDVPLNVNGVSQAQRIAKRLSALPLNAIYSSDLLRAKQTAEEIKRHHEHTQLVTFNDLRERSFGDWEGLFYDQLTDLYPDYTPNKEVGGMYGIETIESMQSRGMERLTNFTSIHQDEHIAVVSHGALINTLLHHLSKGVYGPGKSRLGNTCLNHLSFKDGAWIIHAVNDTTHLDEESENKNEESM